VSTPFPSTDVIDGLPNLCGAEDAIADAMRGSAPVTLAESDVDFAQVRSAFAIALHMHQPLMPAGGGDLAAAPVIGNLQFMLEHPEVQDAHNAAPFLGCYARMGQFIPQLVAEGRRPRVMLDYSGTLLYALRQMGRGDVLDALRPLAADPALRRCVEWLGTAWGHAVAPSTPAQDFRLHVRAWQHHFASIFGPDALHRVRGFSPPEMALPNHPDVFYEFVRTLLDCGYRWLLVQEHTVERLDDGAGLRTPHLPHTLVARNSRGQELRITALVKTQGSDTKLVGQMQPYYEAKGLSRLPLAGRDAPPLVTQVSDGENGGVMMNEFPSKFMEVMREAPGTATVPMNGTEYLEHLAAAGIDPASFPLARPRLQKRIWDRFEDGAGPERLAAAIADIRRADGGFNVDGGSWTADRSWVGGYDNVLGPMERASAAFAQRMLAPNVPTTDPRYRAALFNLLAAQTSCFRYWGQGTWTDYGRELCRRAAEAAG